MCFITVIHGIDYYIAKLLVDISMERSELIYKQKHNIRLIEEANRVALPVMSIARL